MSIIFLETLNIEWGQIDPKGNRRVKCATVSAGKMTRMYWKYILRIDGRSIILFFVIL